MSRTGKILIFSAALIAAIGGAARILYQPWADYFWIPFAVSGALLIGAFVKDLKFYLELLSMRTTKHGLNLGSVILLLIVGLTGINYVAYKNNKKWDVTEEKLNSLSNQTVQLVQGLDEDLRFLAFFREDDNFSGQEKQKFEYIMGMFQAESSKVKPEFVNVLKRPDLVKQYGIDSSGTVIMLYKGRQNTLTDLSEQGIANAIVKLTRDGKKVIYFLTGHGEVSFSSTEPNGADRLKRALEESNYEVKSLNFVETQKIPEDASVLAVVGSQTALFAPEIAAIEKFVEDGGRLLVAADPGRRSNLKDLISKFGVELKDVFIVDPFGKLLGASAALAIGAGYSNTHAITKGFSKGQQEQMTLFHLASPLKRAEGFNESWRFEELVKTTQGSFTTMDLGQQVRFDPARDERGPLAVAAVVEGSAKSESADSAAPGEAKKKSDFAVVVFGDSDFLTNQLLDEQLNRDLALNSFSFLAKEDDLISIRPKIASGSRLTLNESQIQAMIYFFFIPLPLVLFAISSVIWFRRRGA
ncbi:MAG: hypothetical protein COT74_02395 [Bdellovibrionales bacterium CG10_big_fil_rev_8_21_14_0_10_45_34]|nr:MAG: hypothetical protein COT74_02395 [Bdellovibrionales bacterium CG10_big_fil_rev_8_21_14_0_10_45_34]